MSSDIGDVEFVARLDYSKSAGMASGSSEDSFIGARVICENNNHILARLDKSGMLNLGYTFNHDRWSATLHTGIDMKREK